MQCRCHTVDVGTCVAFATRATSVAPGRPPKIAHHAASHSTALRECACLTRYSRRYCTAQACGDTKWSAATRANTTETQPPVRLQVPRTRRLPATASKCGARPESMHDPPRTIGRVRMSVRTRACLLWTQPTAIVVALAVCCIQAAAVRLWSDTPLVVAPHQVEVRLGLMSLTIAEVAPRECLVLHVNTTLPRRVAIVSCEPHPRVRQRPPSFATMRCTVLVLLPEPVDPRSISSMWATAIPSA